MAKTEPKATSITVSYSLGRKVSDGNYGSQDFHLSKTENWNVEGMTPSEVEKFWNNRFIELHDQVGEIAMMEEEEMLGKKVDWSLYRDDDDV